MATVINKTSTNYHVSNETSTIKIEGDMVYNNTINDKIDSFNGNVTLVKDGSYVGNIYYSEYDGNGGNNMNTNLDFKYMMEAITLLQTIINDVKTNIN